MLQLSLDQTAIATTVLGNILLSFSIHLQKYVKKRILHLALHGVQHVSLKQVWKLGLSLLVVAECSYFVALGIFSDNDHLSSLIVYTMIANIVLPPLFYEHHEHTITGSLLSQSGILLLILTKPDTQSITIKFDWSDTSTKAAIGLELLLGIGFVIVRSYRPVNCSWKIFATCGISSLMGSHVATAVRAMSILPQSDKLQPILAAIVLISFVIELNLVSESLQFFSAFQVVPHHFAMLLTMDYFNKMTVFKGSDEFTGFELLTVSLAHILMIWGVWIAAKPHLDLPMNIVETGLLPELEQRATNRLTAAASVAISGHSRTDPNPDCPECPLDTRWGHACLREEFCRVAAREWRSQGNSSAFV